MRSGDDTTYEELYRRHADAVRRYARTNAAVTPTRGRPHRRGLRPHAPGGTRRLGPGARGARLPAHRGPARRRRLDPVGRAGATGRRLRGVRRTGRAHHQGGGRRHPWNWAPTSGPCTRPSSRWPCGPSVPCRSGGRPCCGTPRSRTSRRARWPCSSGWTPTARAYLPAGPRGSEAGLPPGPCQRCPRRRRGVRPLRRPARHLRARQAAHPGRTGAAQGTWTSAPGAGWPPARSRRSRAGFPPWCRSAVIGWFGAARYAKATGIIAGGAGAAGAAGAAATTGGGASGGAGAGGGAAASEGLGAPVKAGIAAGVVAVARRRRWSSRWSATTPRRRSRRRPPRPHPHRWPSRPRTRPRPRRGHRAPTHRWPHPSRPRPRRPPQGRRRPLAQALPPPRNRPQPRPRRRPPLPRRPPPRPRLHRPPRPSTSGASWRTT